MNVQRKGSTTFLDKAKPGMKAALAGELVVVAALPVPDLTGKVPVVNLQSGYVHQLDGGTTLHHVVMSGGDGGLTDDVVTIGSLGPGDTYSYGGELYLMTALPNKLGVCLRDGTWHTFAGRAVSVRETRDLSPTVYSVVQPTPL